MNYLQSYYGQPGGYQHSYSLKRSNNRLASDGPQSDYIPSYNDSTKKYQKLVKSTIDIINQHQNKKYQAEQDESDDDFRKRQNKPPPEESFYSGNQYGNFFQRLSRVENRLYKFNSKYEIDHDKLNPLLYNY